MLNIHPNGENQNNCELKLHLCVQNLKKCLLHLMLYVKYVKVILFCEDYLDG